MAELADALDLGSSGQPCGFDSHYPYQARRKRHITCDELFHFIAKLHRALILLLLASKPDPLCWAPVWVRRFTVNLSRYGEISILTAISN